MAINRWTDKEFVVHIHNRILLSHKKEPFESVLIRWMNLESTIQMEVNQKNKYHILMHVYRIYRDSTDELICRAAIETQTERTDLCTWRLGEEERMG